MVSADEKGLIEYWSPESLEFPKNVDFELKSDTDLFEFAKVRRFWAPLHCALLDLFF